MSALLHRVRAGASARLAVARQDRDAGAALLTVLLFILVLTILSVVVLGSLVSQVRPTAFTQDSSRSLFAAEAGVQATLGQVRTAVKVVGPDTYGDPAKLPCALKGTVGEAGQALTYDVTISYFGLDPAGQDAGWRAANALACTTGTALTPSFAIITSTGRADESTAGKAYRSAGPRTLESKYTFKLTNKNIAGGLMYTVTQQACLEAASTSVDATVSYRAASSCSSGTATQMWVYDTDYAIKLAVTTGTTTGSGSTGTSSELCITRPGANGPVTVKKCVKGQPDQLWGYEGGAIFKGQNSANTGTTKLCLWSNVDSGNPSGRQLYAGPRGCDSSNQDWGSFSPEPRVGAGAASKKTNQIVNYLEFGRCFDVTGQEVAAAFMIVYPCKQDPSGGTGVLWNHKWYYTEPTAPATSSATRIEVLEKDDVNKRTCLTTPVAGTTPAYVTLKACDGSARQGYTRTYDTSSYATSYTFVAADGRCLSIGPRASASGVNWSTIVAASCTGGAEQKWNAPPNALSASLSDTRELLTTSAGG